MAVSSQQVAAASEVLTDTTKTLFIIEFRKLDLYRTHARIFSPMIQARLDSATNTIKGKILNAIRTQLDNLGTGQVEIRGDEDAVWWSQEKERQALIADAFLVLFDDIVDVAPTGGIDVITPATGVYGVAAVGQRPQYCGICGYYISCSSSYVSSQYGCNCGGTLKRLSSYGY